jgi:NAD(P)H-dependent flavin oxidoreductase YrpB (nitropropane dioxygenase family)
MAPVFRTAITELFGIEHPILLGGMHHVGQLELVAEVVNAGAMSFITPRSFDSLLEYRDDLRRCRDLTRGRPFGVNLATSRRPGWNEGLSAWIDIAIEEGVRHFESEGASPGDLIGRIHDRGGMLIQKYPSVRHARTAERLGVDAVALAGLEEFDPPGANRLPTSANVAAALHQLRIPVALGGGVRCGRQVAATLALGAAGVVIDRVALADATEPAGAFVARLMRDAARAAYAFAGTFGAPARADALRST